MLLRRRKYLSLPVMRDVSGLLPALNKARVLLTELAAERANSAERFHKLVDRLFHGGKSVQDICTSWQV